MFPIDWLSASGHRLSTGEPNSSGLLRVLSPGTQAEVPIFDSTGASISQPVELDASGRTTVYVDGPVDLSFEDFSGAAVQTMPYGDVHGADGVLVESAAFTGTLASGSQGAGGRTYLDVVLARALTSFGGTDFQYQESSSAVNMPVRTWMTGVQLNVKGFGAKGDNLQIDTSFLQLALNRCAALGGGRVYFPPGTYLTDAALTVPAKVAIVGAGSAVSIIKGTNSGQNGLTLSSAGTGNNLIQGIQITHLTTSTGFGVSCVSTNFISLIDVTVGAQYANGARMDGCNDTVIRDCSLACISNAANRGILYTTSGDRHHLANVSFAALLGICVECATGNSGIALFGCQFLTGAVGVKVTSSDNDDLIRVVACEGLANNMSAGFSEGTSGQARALFQVGNMIDGYAQDLTSGGTHTLDPFLRGRYIRLRGTTTGSAYAISSPVQNANTRDFDFTVEFFNNAGGAVTGWTLPANMRVSAIVPVADLAKTAVTFRWDSAALVYRETARAQTT